MTRFHISIHDVAPPFAAEIGAILDALAPLVGAQLSCALVPRWHDQPWTAADAPLLRRVCACAELLQHGYDHRATSRGVLAQLTGAANELTGLSAAAAATRLALGRAELRRLLGAAPAGFVPPAWQRGPLDLVALWRIGFGYAAGLTRVRRADGGSLALATTSWDAGRRWLWPLTECCGSALRLLPGALPMLVLHPADVRRGLLPRALAAVRRLLDAGCTPLLLHEALADAA